MDTAEPVSPLHPRGGVGAPRGVGCRSSGLAATDTPRAAAVSDKAFYPPLSANATSHEVDRASLRRRGGVLPWSRFRGARYQPGGSSISAS
jgi:hypothetical protein